MEPQTPSPAPAPGRSRITAPLSGLPDLTGRTAVVTGGAGGLGLATARGLARKGADVLLGVRDTERGEQARRRLIEQDHVRPQQVTIAQLDLLDLASVHRFAAEAARRPLDILVLNAGISSVPLRLSRQGVESQFATNHLGHFALAGRLLDVLGQGTDPRVVTVSSALYKGGVLDVDDLAGAHGYSPGRAYSRSKLANTMFAVELGHRLAESDSPVRSFAAHPGMARTPLHTTYPSAVTRVATAVAARVIGRDPGPAAVAVLTAAASAQVDPRLFWGPAGSHTRPDALGVPFAAVATDRSAARRLWSASVRLTGVDPWG
ncbi:MULTISPECIES: SDR family NAD(P)-dependent oxidoreductase [unclassified Streptomyces]|uniref:SDR family NAD(P)-dependent oxidoreductase n=1 Tax=unclassified Streptomyces TaxID=2593676 RepID=UPI001903A879|nr:MULTISPECIES: SDR family NAD(P)-dependent oxidoreductase [unclassified Streptomyces]MCU4746875.1 SDR family NAD(P)-dependent oxidoreductase [Streptomyces sp. G-5]QQN77572.1 SDR family NAD(P)-dependent oxidoreductase [Streptomyces sp. XC 2026]